MSAGDASWQGLSFPTGEVYAWEPDSTYIRKAPYFDGITKDPAPVKDILGARALAVLGDSVTTDHISPAGNIKANGPAGNYLSEHGVKPADFNSYGSRRGLSLIHICFIDRGQQFDVGPRVAIRKTAPAVDRWPHPPVAA